MPTPATTDPDNKGPARAPTADEHAREEIGQLITNYCAALESLKPARIRALFHVDNERELKEGFKEYKSLKCSITSEPKYDRLNSGSVGGAQVKFGIKEVVKMGSGGAPTTLDLIVTMLVSRDNFQSPWLIDRLTHEEKPK
ncbi:MAG: hypothetical protein ACJ731_05370 [Vicinamibacterales bacterium]